MAGETNLTLAFQPITVSLVNGTINVNTPEIDADGDNIPDSWEEVYFPEDLTHVTLSTNGDYDRDGYTDYQEYLNGYNPTVKDPAGGPGYNPPQTGTLPAILMLLLQNDV